MDESAESLFSGPGEMRARGRALDWRATPLGPVERWPEALRGAVRICLESRFQMCVYGGPEHVVVYNDAYIAVHGAGKHPWALGRPAREVWPEIWADLGPACAAVLAGGPPMHVENAPFVIARDGRIEETYWTLSLSAVREADGSVVGLLGVGLETTAEVRMARALRASHGRQTFLLRLSDALRPLTNATEVASTATRLLGAYLGVAYAAFCVVEADGDAFAVAGEHGAERAAGAESPRGSLRDGGPDFGPVLQAGGLVAYGDLRDDPRPHPGALAGATSDPMVAGAAAPVIMDRRLVAFLHVADPAPRAWSDDELRLMRDGAGRAWASVARAQAEAAQAAAEDARRVAEAASRAKDELLAVVSHELRAPLAPARALALCLTGDDSLTREQRGMAAEIAQHIAYEARIVDNLLEYEGATRGVLSVQCRRCDVHEVVRRTARGASPAFRSKSIPLALELAAEDPLAWADPIRVQQIVYNLLQNAAQYSPWGAGVVVRTHNPTPDAIELAVVDAGVGIGPEQLARLFQPFVRGSAAGSGRPGLGLGLAFSRRLAELQGGTLAAASDGRGRGSTFTLRLPTARALGGEGAAEESSADAPPDADEPTRPVSDAVGDDARLRVLVVDDDPSTARAMHRLLAGYGHVVYDADGLVAAERIADVERLDVVLCDLQLQGESGLDAPRRVGAAARRRGFPPPRFVVLSGYGRPSDLAASRAAGFDAHLAKPVDETALRRSLGRAAPPVE